MEKNSITATAKSNRKYITTPDAFETIVCDVEEQETTINVERELNVMRIFTADNTMLTKLKKTMFGSNNKGEWKAWEGSRDSNGNITGYFFEAPKKLLSLRSGSKTARTMTEEQKKAAAERFKKARAAKKG